MHIAVLAAPESWYVRDLQRAAGDRHRVEPLPFSQLSSRLGGTGPASIYAAGRELSEFDAVLVRSMPPGSLEQVVFRMDLLGQLEAAGGLVVNSPRGMEAAIDKYVALARLQQAGLLTPPTIVCQSVDEALEAFAVLGGDVVVKPIFGGEGRGLMRVEDPNLALRVIKTLFQLSAVIYLQQFLPHRGYDIRAFVMGDRIYGMQRRNPLDWRTNVSRGATAEPVHLTEPMQQMARRAAAAVDVDMAGVDLLPTVDGQLYVIEVNAVPGWRALAQAIDHDMGADVLGYLEQRWERRLL
ncbi:ATP-grasp domain-containing protein [Lignipirellula cremea]|uniref:Ribosomal protein S6 modification protein n=1 Tax=Lignipirellula cremea TaxID=2528010 RepID=A0A518E2N8_9BACT|nr:RimK family alpha-L-glutamate ligase [Lignipirellula cremea]QDU98359.1 Ribosomal protein S6 modification protein [Lignipirellula cremea]